MQEADDDIYETFPESLRVIALTGTGYELEALAVADHPDADVPLSHQTFVRYLRADESDLHGFVPEHWQADVVTLRLLMDRRMAQFNADIAELQAALDANAPSTRDRLQRVRGVVARMQKTWSGRSELLDKKKGLDVESDMI